MSVRIAPSRLGLLTLIAGLSLVGCGPEAPGTATEVVVEIDAEDLVKAEAGSLRVEIEGGDDVDALRGRVSRLDETVKPIEFPKRVALVPLGGDSRRAFVLTATVLDDDGDFVAQARLISGYVAGQLRYAKLLIEAGKCLRLKCDGDRETCTNGACVDAKVDVTTLSTLDTELMPVSFLEPNTDAGETDGGQTGNDMDGGHPDTDEDSGQVDADADAEEPLAPAPVVECEDRQGGDQFCRGNDRMTCAPDRATVEADACPTGEVCVLTGKEVECVADPDECAMHVDDCDDEPDACLNTFGSYNCQCPDGYQGDGRGAQGCADKNECAGGAIAACGSGATGCTNVPGSFTCSCGGAYLPNPDGRGCHLGAWGTATLLQEGAGQASWTSLQWKTMAPSVAASDGTGNVIAIWGQFDGTRINIWANRYIAGRGWETATMIETGNAGSAYRPAVAVDPSGNAVAVWQQDDGMRTNIWANHYTSGIWGTATMIETDNAGNASSADVAIDPSGNAVAVWQQNDGTRTNIWANRYTPADGWSTAARIETDNAGDATIPAVAVDSSGNAVAVWIQSDGTQNNVWANRHTSHGSWGNATMIEDNAGDAYSPAVAVDPSGNAVAVWEQSEGTAPSNIWANHYTSGGSWGSATLIETDNTGQADSSAVAVAPSGNAVTVWEQYDGKRYNVWANSYTSGGTWGNATLIETGNAGYAGYPAVAVDSSGNAVAVWQQSDGTRDNIWASRYTGGRWGNATLIEADDAGKAWYPAVTVDLWGNATAVWVQSDGTRTKIWANRFE